MTTPNTRYVVYMTLEEGVDRLLWLASLKCGGVERRDLRVEVRRGRLSGWWCGEEGSPYGGAERRALRVVVWRGGLSGRWCGEEGTPCGGEERRALREVVRRGGLSVWW